uniref:Uncharacterized protein n=1 Tax=Vitis vinifera TaxID=29760 RepID=F6HH89_VITVI
MGSLKLVDYVGFAEAEGRFYVGIAMEQALLEDS